MDYEKSFVRFVQLCSGKSEGSLSAGSLYFYPLLATLLNLTENVKRAHINSGRAIFAYFSVSLSLPDDELSSRLIGRMFGRIDTIQAFHGNVRIALELLAVVYLRRVSVKKLEGINLIQYSMAVYTSQSLLKQKTCSLLKGGMSPLSLCHRCVIRNENSATSGSLLAVLLSVLYAF